MSGYTMVLTLDRPHHDVVSQVKEALADQGFGVLTEIDVRATMKAKLGVDVPDQVILGACRPELAHRALDAAPSIAALLPCNVVVRTANHQTVVEVVDPAVMNQPGGRHRDQGGRDRGPLPLVSGVACSRDQHRGGMTWSSTPPRCGPSSTAPSGPTAIWARLISMMEEGADCEDVLTQLAAVLKALERTGFAIVATGLQQCIAAGDGPESVDVKKMEKLFLGLA